MLFPMSIGEQRYRRNANLAIVNLQPTPLDDIAEIRIWAKVDDVMERVMEELRKDKDL